MPAKGQDRSCPHRHSKAQLMGTLGLRAPGEQPAIDGILREWFRPTPYGSKKMNMHDPNLATPKVTTGPLPASRKTYARPDAAPDLRVPVREILLTEAAGEPPLPVYDTTGPYTDPDVTIDVEKGVARNRSTWVRERGGVEEYAGRRIRDEDNGGRSGG